MQYQCPPLTRNVPKGLAGSGHEAIQLAASAGLVLDPWQCQVMHDSLREDARGRWSAFEVGVIVSRQNGKGSALEARVLAGMLLFGERLILWSAHETKTAFEAFRRCEDLFRSDPDLFKLVKTIHRSNGSEGIELHNGSRLRFVARSKGSGRGFSADLIILDEAYALTSDQMSALIPTLASRPNPQIWYTSSPPLAGDEGEQLYHLRERARVGDQNLCWLDWGLPDVDLSGLDDLDLTDEALWRKTNPSFGIRISRDFIGREYATLNRQDFARERLGIWPKRITGGEGSPIDADLWESLLDPDAATAPRPVDVVFGLDVNPARTHAAIVACARRADGLFQLAVVEYRQGTEWCVDRLVQLRDRWGPLALAVDSKGPAGALLLDLAEAGFRLPDDAEKPRRGQLAVPNAGEAAQAYGLIVDAVRQGGVRHLGDAPLTTAVLGAKVRPLAGGGAWDRKAGVDISPLVAGTLAHWGFVTRESLARGSEYDLLKSIY